MNKVVPRHQTLHSKKWIKCAIHLKLKFLNSILPVVQPQILYLAPSVGSVLIYEQSVCACQNSFKLHLFYNITYQMMHSVLTQPSW